MSRKRKRRGGSATLSPAALIAANPVVAQRLHAVVAAQPQPVLATLQTSPVGTTAAAVGRAAGQGVIQAPTLAGPGVTLQQQIEDHLRRCGWQANRYTWIKSVNPEIPIPYRKGVYAHVTINKASVATSCARAPRHATVASTARRLNFHVTVEVGDDYYDQGNPRWYRDGRYHNTRQLETDADEAFEQAIDNACREIDALAA